MLVDVCNGVKDRYRFGFNGQEKVNEWAGIGNFMEFSERGYDSRTARFPSVDPLKFNFPGYSPYIFAMNRPIDGYDAQGMKWVKFNPDNVGLMVFNSSHINGTDGTGRGGDPTIQKVYNASLRTGMNIVVVSNWEELLNDLEEKNKKFNNIYFEGHGYISGGGLNFFSSSYDAGLLQANAEPIIGIGDFTNNVVLLGCFEGAPKMETGSPDKRYSMINKVEARMKFATLIGKPVYSNKGYTPTGAKMLNGGYLTLFGHAKGEEEWIDNMNEKNRGWRVDNPDGTSKEFNSLFILGDSGNFGVIDFKAMKESLKKGANRIADWAKKMNVSSGSNSNSSRATDNWKLPTN